MGINITDDEVQDLRNRAKVFKGRKFPIKKLIKGKNVDVEYSFEKISKIISIQEIQKGEEKKEKRYSVYAILIGENGEQKKKPLSEVVEYFENINLTT